MDAQPNRQGRRRRRRKKKPEIKAVPTEPVVVVARRPDSPRLEKPTRRMKAASARPRTRSEHPVGSGLREETRGDVPRHREARIVQRKQDEVDEREQTRRRLLARFLASEGRAAVTRSADTYFSEGFELPEEQEPQLKLLEHFDETHARRAIACLAQLIESEQPRQLPVFRQRLRRLEDYADDPETRGAAAALRRALPA